MQQRSVRTRPRGWFSLFLAHFGWVAVLATLAVLLLTAKSVWEYRADSVWAHEGVAVDATVKAVKVSDAGVTLLRIQYRVDDRWYGTQVPVNAAKAARYPQGRTITVYYLPQEPAVVKTHRMASRVDGLLFEVLAAFAGVIALGFASYAGHTANDAVRTRRHGSRIKAVVTRIEAIGARKNKPKGEGRLVFQLPDGTFGKTMVHPWAAMIHWSRDDRINVYLGPKRAWWDGDVGPRELIRRSLPKVPAHRPE